LWKDFSGRVYEKADRFTHRSFRFTPQTGHGTRRIRARVLGSFVTVV
jgi:hypothetical protein